MRFVSCNDQNAAGNDSANENYSFSLIAVKRSTADIQNINSNNRHSLEDVLVIFLQKYVKPDPQATAKHKWHRIIFNLNTLKLPDFLEEQTKSLVKTQKA